MSEILDIDKERVALATELGWHSFRYWGREKSLCAAFKGLLSVVPSRLPSLEDLKAAKQVGSPEKAAELIREGLDGMLGAGHGVTVTHWESRHDGGPEVFFPPPPPAE